MHFTQSDLRCNHGVHLSVKLCFLCYQDGCITLRCLTLCSSMLNHGCFGHMPWQYHSITTKHHGTKHFVLLLRLLENVTDSLLKMFGFANELQQANDSLYSNSSLYLLILSLAQD